MPTTDDRLRDRLSDRLIDQLGLLTLLMASAALVATDFALALDPLWSLVFTGVEMLFAIPWAFTVSRLDRRDPRMGRGRRRRNASAAVAHGVNVVLLLACLVGKLPLVLAARDGQAVPPGQYQMLTVAGYVLVNVGLLGRGARVGRLLLSLSDRPARLTTASFGLASLAGALVLNLPPALRRAEDASFVDSLFTAVSAVCVTGLVVHDTGQTYTPFGQGVIFVLFQAGGLGIMVLYAAFAILAGRRLRVRSTAVLTELVDAQSMSQLKRTLLSIVLVTLAVEAAGTLALYLCFQDDPRVLQGPGGPAGARSPLWAAAFHAVSAFCNAGFSLFRHGFEPFAGDWGVSVTLMLLIAVGGLGFPVLSELVRLVVRRLRGHRPDRLSLHTRVVLAVSALLLAIGVGATLTLEHGGTLAGRAGPERVLTAMFQSVTARTAGFNTLPIGSLSSATLMVVGLLMFIGASPASTGGGIKTSTVAVLFAAFRAELSGRPGARLFDRHLTPSLIRRAVGVFFVSVLFVWTLLLALLVTEPHDPFQLAFEVVSAYATVGLSTGITPELSVFGKLVIAFAMFIGRIGPLTLGLALANPHAPQPRAQLADENVTIG